MRITLDSLEVKTVIAILENFKDKNQCYDTNKEIIIEKFKKELTKPISKNKQKATKKANLAKKKNTENIIQNTLNLMLFEGKKINVNSVSKESGLAYNTVKKYKLIISKYK